MPTQKEATERIERELDTFLADKYGRPEYGNLRHFGERLRQTDGDTEVFRVIFEKPNYSTSVVQLDVEPDCLYLIGEGEYPLAEVDTALDLFKKQVEKIPSYWADSDDQNL